MSRGGRWALALCLIACSGPDDPPAEVPAPTADTAATDTGPTGPLAADAGPDLFVVPGTPFVLDAGDVAADVEVEWTLSDGQVLQGSPVEATLDTPGHFSVVLELRRSESSSTDGALVTSVYEKLTTPPSSSGPIFSSPDGLYISVRHLDQVLRIDGSDGTIIERFDVCDEPVSLTGSADGVVVVCAGDDTVARVGATDPLQLPWGAEPRAVLSLADGALLVQGAGRGEAYVVDPSLALTARAPTVVDGRALASLPTEAGVELVIPRFRSEGHEARVERLLLDGDGLPIEADTLILTPDPGPDSDTNARGVPNLLGAVSIRPDGRQVAVAGLKANVERGLARDGQALRSDATVRADLRLLSRDPSTGALSEDDAVVFDDRDRVVALAWSDRGDWLYAAHGGMELIDVIDPFTAQRAGVSTPVGGLVDGLWVDGDALWALSSLGRVLVRYDLTNPTLPTEVDRIDLTPPGGEPADPVVLEGERWFHRSNDNRLNSGGYIACASCHPEGEHDGLTWDFTDRGEGLRNTLPLVGRGGEEHGPLHWSANFDEPQDFEHDIRGPQAGRGLMDDEDFAATDHPLGAPKEGLSADLDALAAYVRSLTDVPRSPFRADDGSMTDAALRGQALFEDPMRLCIQCHPAPTYTDSAFVDDGEGGRAPNLHDVGTLDPTSGMRLGEGALTGVDTPTLRGTGVTGPWGHRGQAETLLELFPPGDLHGFTSDLSPAELADLEAFLLQLQ